MKYLTDLVSTLQPLLDLFMRVGTMGVIGLLSFVSAIAVAMSAVTSLAPIFRTSSGGFAAFIRQWFLGVIGLLPKRKSAWGTIYDASTKRPIPFAKVQLLDRNKRVLETRVADRDGRYGFLTSPESLLAQRVQISILPRAGGYIFPARTPASVDTFIYNNLYYGDLVTISDRTLVNFDVPMDPVAPVHASLMVTSPSIALGASVAAIADAGFWIGLVMVPLNFILLPNPFTFGVLCLFLGTASLRIFGITEHAFGTITDRNTGAPVPFALITLNDLNGKRIAFAVSDEQGRYFMVAGRGTYEIAVFTSAAIIPARQARRVVHVKHGWVTQGIAL